jgi:hypothetical protein
MPPTIFIAVVEVTIPMAVVKVIAPRKIVAMIVVWALHIPRTATLPVDAAVVGALHRDSAVAVQPVMHIHAPLGVMHVADPAVGPGANRAAAAGDALMAAPGHGTTPELSMAAAVVSVVLSDSAGKAIIAFT